MQKPALLFSLDILDTILFLGKGGRHWGRLGKCLSFIPESYFQTLKISTVYAEEICRGCQSGLVISYLWFLSLGMQSFLSGRNTACPWDLFQQHSLMLADGHCDFGHVSGRVACTLPSQNAMSSGSKKATAGDFIVADFIFDLNYTMCSLFFRATEIINLLNLRVSSKGKGSVRIASSSVARPKARKVSERWQWHDQTLSYSSPPNPFWDKETKSNRPVKIHVSSQEQKNSKRTVFHLIGMARTSLFSEKRANQSHKGKTGPPSVSHLHPVAAFLHSFR